jgi:hypothetical protein
MVLPALFSSQESFDDLEEERKKEAGIIGKLGRYL